MLLGSVVERRRRCGEPNYRCAKNEDGFHLRFELSVLWRGKHCSFHIPAEMAEKVRHAAELGRQFQDLVATIDETNPR